LHKFVILNVTEGGVKDLLYLSFNIGASTVFTIGFSGGDALDAAFPLERISPDLGGNSGARCGFSVKKGRSVRNPMEHSTGNPL
jgi:hypothetical protein